MHLAKYRIPMKTIDMIIEIFMAIILKQKESNRKIKLSLMPFFIVSTGDPLLTLIFGPPET